MAHVTLIGEKLAKKDNEFIYLGPQNDCKNCKLKTACFNLKTGRTYKITKIRENRHKCKIHEGKTAVIEVEEQPLILTINSNLKQGQQTKITKKNCSYKGCAYYEYCTNNYLQEKNYNITKIIEDNIQCPKGLNLNKAELSDQ